MGGMPSVELRGALLWSMADSRSDFDCARFTLVFSVMALEQFVQHSAVEPPFFVFIFGCGRRGSPSLRGAQKFMCVAVALHRWHIGSFKQCEQLW